VCRHAGACGSTPKWRNVWKMFGTSFPFTYVHSHSSAYICSNVDIPNCQAGDNAYWVSYEREAHEDEPALYEPAHNRSSRESTQQGTYFPAYEHADGENDSVWSTNDEPFCDPYKCADEEDPWHNHTRAYTNS
jgi:hypothetical protein